MTGASLGYSGYYNGISLHAVGVTGERWSSTISNTQYSRYLRIDTSATIGPQQNYGSKYIARAVRWHTTQIISKAFAVTTRFKQVSTKYIQIVTSATTIGIRRPIISMC